MAEILLTTHERIEAVLEEIDRALKATKPYIKRLDRAAPVNRLRGALMSARACIVDDQADIDRLDELMGAELTDEDTEYQALLIQYYRDRRRNHENS